VTVDADFTDKANVDKLTSFLLEKFPSLTDNILKSNTQTTATTFGSSFFRQTFIAILIAFLFMGVVVFLYFRMFVPSIAVILAAFSDMVGTLAISNLIGIKLSSAGIVAFLLLIGYSVDTDILLSVRVLRGKEGSLMDKIFNAMKTGLTMSVTTMVAVTVALIFSQSDVLRQIMTILLIGLLLDLINTWLQNASLLRWYLEKKNG